MWIKRLNKINTHTKTFEKLFLVILFLLTVFLRLWQLGYSDFYGDETKVFFLRKDISATEFLLNQRKGPTQFLVTWVAEKGIGGYDELWTRFPFAIAGIAAVFVLYFLVKEIYGRRVAAIASILMSLNGFYIAFSRTVQYQSFLLLFGLLSLLFFIYYTKNIKKPYYLVLSAVFLAFAYLSHWDAVFYDLVIAMLMFNYVYEAKKTKRKEIIKDLVIYLAIPFLVVIGIYFIPYFFGGYFSNQVIGYIQRRVEGSNQLPNNSSFTFWLYNPEIAFYFPFLFMPFAFAKYKKGIKFETIMLIFWFLVPFTLFQFFIANPGTHTQNYFLPLIILSALGFVYFYELLPTRLLKDLVNTFALFSILVMFTVSSYSFVPFVNNGYPWSESSRGPLVIDPLEKDTHQYFIYGFPYNRGWRQVRAYFELNGMPRSFNTNDNVTVGEYYLTGVPMHRMITSQLPEYYIDIPNNQEFKLAHPLVLTRYELETKLNTVDGNFVNIYKLIN